ncbi:MAG: alpha/beta hydrolase [Sandaracinaceae bacterium]|nr:alpha/beta hydrolase [Sandaracinaceae bacterium]
MAEELVLQGSDGNPIHTYRWVPPSPLRGIVQIAHGMAEHAGRYAPFAKCLNQSGYGAYANDHRGHGKSAKSTEELGHFADKDGWELVQGDALALSDRIRSEHPELPLILFGHSMGSFVALSLLQRFPERYSGMILSGSTLPGGWLERLGLQIARFEGLRLGKRGRSPLISFLSFGLFNFEFAPARTPFDWLSSDPQAVDAYVADPLCGFRCTNQLWIDLLEGLRSIVQRGFAKVPKNFPIHLIAGERDPVSKGGRGVRALADWLKASGLERVTLKIYPGRHELLHERNREEVMREIVQVLDTFIAS